MEFGFTEEQEKLRKEVHDFYVNGLPEDFVPGVHAVSEKLQSFELELQRKTGERGWLTAAWPKEYGGLGLTPLETAVISEQEGYWGIHTPAYHTLGLLGPSILLYGTEAQKKRYLSIIAQGEAVCMELLTEPEAGTDQANIQLRAVEDGDDYILNGQKMFIGEAYKADYLFTLTRTLDIIPKHRGLTLFIVHADTLGITYRPLPVMGDYYKNEAFFDDVRVPKENLLGEMNRGFYINLGVRAQRASGLTGQPGHIRRTLEEFVELCKEEKRNGKPLIEDKEIRKALAQIATEAEMMRLTGWYRSWRYSQKEKSDRPVADLSGFLYRTLSVKHAKTMMDILGSYGQLRQCSKWAKLTGRIERQWRATRSMHGGGTPERLKMTIAERGLGLPTNRRRPTTAKNE
ncbi:acyl-CoA dehydrogenase family protein [Chloroflexota bacterium]